MTAAASIRREAAISFAINAVLSLAFFLGLYGFTPRALRWSAPDGLALDFVPQSLAVALMSALVPALIARRRFRAVITKMNSGRLSIIRATVSPLPTPIDWKYRAY